MVWRLESRVWGIQFEGVEIIVFIEIYLLRFYEWK